MALASHPTAARCALAGSVTEPPAGISTDVIAPAMVMIGAGSLRRVTLSAAWLDESRRKLVTTSVTVHEAPPPMRSAPSVTEDALLGSARR